MKQISQKGFTLIEMVTVLAIFSIMTGIILFNYGKFRSDTILTNMAYEVALSVREAQIYGVSARGANSGGTIDFTTPHGIFFKGDFNQYYLFADVNKDGVFNGTDCITTGGDVCITPYSLQRGVKVTNFQAINPGDQCLSTSIGDVDVVFKRPNPEPVLSYNGANQNITAIQIQLTSSDGASRYVVVYGNGQVSVLTNSICR